MPSRRLAAQAELEALAAELNKTHPGGAPATWSLLVAFAQRMSSPPKTDRG